PAEVAAGGGVVEHAVDAGLIDPRARQDELRRFVLEPFGFAVRRKRERHQVFLGLALRVVDEQERQELVPGVERKRNLFADARRFDFALVGKPASLLKKRRQARLEVAAGLADDE